MAETVTMPKLGFDMAEGTLVRWVVPEGGEVDRGAVLAEIETDKATVEVESNFSGTLLRQLVQEGTVIPVGEPIAVIGEPGEKVEEQAPTEEVVAAASDATAGGFTAKELAEGEVETGRGAATAQPKEVREPSSQAKEQQAEESAEKAQAEEGEETGLPGGMRASPVARRLAEERGIDLSKVKGSGPLGRIIKKDVEAYAEKAPAEEPAAAPARAPEAAAPAPARAAEPGAVPGEQVPLSRLRAAIGRRMVEAKQQVPHFYVTIDVAMEALMDMRKQINAALPEGEKLSVNDFIVKAAALALREFPSLNASFNGDSLIRHENINIGVAVAVENGLLTVVCRNADQKSLRQISNEVRTMAGRAREGKVRPDEIEGSTFSISNLGMFDVDHFIAIINPPEAAILAIGSAIEVPVVKDGAIVPGWRMKATLSVDHRVSDGAEAARFLQVLKPYLEQPLLMM